jgi:hypothetical protein
MKRLFRSGVWRIVVAFGSALALGVSVTILWYAAMHFSWYTGAQVWLYARGYGGVDSWYTDDTERFRVRNDASFPFAASICLADLRQGDSGRLFWWPGKIGRDNTGRQTYVLESTNPYGQIATRQAIVERAALERLQEQFGVTRSELADWRGVTLYRSGVPWLAFERRQYEPRFPVSPTAFAAYWFGGDGLIRPRAISVLGLEIWFPTRLLWSGFIANSIFWGVLLGMVPLWLGRVVRAWRARVRRCAGRCAACAHELAGLATCPECGTPVAAPVGRSERALNAVFSAIECSASAIWSVTGGPLVFAWRWSPAPDASAGLRALAWVRTLAFAAVGCVIAAWLAYAIAVRL